MGEAEKSAAPACERCGGGWAPLRGSCSVEVGRQDDAAVVTLPVGVRRRETTGELPRVRWRVGGASAMPGAWGRAPSGHVRRQPPYLVTLRLRQGGFKKRAREAVSGVEARVGAHRVGFRPGFGRSTPRFSAATNVSSSEPRR